VVAHPHPGRAISDQARLFLIQLARDAIAARLEGRPQPSTRPTEPELLELRGAFVTLTIDRRLRGCIGHVEGVSPLWLAVRDNAVAAAFRDPRFEPLTREELDDVRIEISALTPMTPGSPDDVVVGRDGILIERGRSRGLLLPQVAVEYGWDTETFLDATCRKAGLEGGSWRDPGTRISTFSAEVFGED
jgi:AmmeMemoRadiSam system protein A